MTAVRALRMRGSACLPAAYAIKLLGVKHVIPMHCGTFAFLTGSVEDLRNETKTMKGLKIHALKPGEQL